MDGLIQHRETINKLLARYGVKFGIYKNGEFKEHLFPFDPIPRVIGHEEFAYLEKGLKQRVDALNCFLRDIYGKKQILRDGVIPEEFVFSAKGYLPPCDGVMPPKGIYSHISGSDLVCENDNLYYVDYEGRKRRVGAVYRRISDEYLDPMTFYEDSVIGIPHVFEAYKKGNVALLNAPGNGVADDKGIYYFVPKMISYYLGEEAILHNAPTYLPYDETGGRVSRKADLRAFVLTGSTTQVWPSGLTRFSRNPNSFIVNSSQGGGFKDTWVLSR